MDFVGLTIHFLKILAAYVGSYGVAIIVLTLIMRAAMWPLNVSQQRNMRAMQTLQPKLKAIQESWTDNAIISTDNYTILKLYENSYDILTVPSTN